MSVAPPDPAPPPAVPAPARKDRRQQLANLPNALTLFRLVLCIAFFAILLYATQILRLPVDAEGELHWRHFTGATRDAHAGLHGEGSFLTLLFNIAFGIFLLAAATDSLDGQIARRYGLETDL